MNDRRPAITVADFKIGDRVRFVPGHAHGDIHHPDCEDGIVTSKDDEFVFARFRGPGGEACDPVDLVKR